MIGEYMLEISNFDFIDDIEIKIPIEMLISLTLLVGIGIGACMWYVRK
tara:strand:- start:1098 stop:1241 length:144 start_codon:yes stop_codon:yes gene_type:complete